MNTYIALFRGINVGGKNILPMKDLVASLEGLGFSNIRTYIQSGNVIFQTGRTARDKIASAIASTVLTDYGFEPRVLLLDMAELMDAVKHNPFDTHEGKALHFFFLDALPKQAELEKLNALKSPSEKFRLNKKLFYLYAPQGIGRSKLAAGAEKCLGVPVTARNWNTVNKLVDMAGQIQGESK